MIFEGVNPKSGDTEARPAEASAPFSGLVFKIMSDKHLGQLSFVRIYSGTIKAGSYAFNSVKGSKERVGRLMLMHANKREDIDEASAGEIIAIGGMRQVTTGDTVCDENKPIVLEAMDFPAPVIRVAVEPKTRADQDKMGIALNRLAQEDPSFNVSTAHETHSISLPRKRWTRRGDRPAQVKIHADGANSTAIRAAAVTAAASSK